MSNVEEREVEIKEFPIQDIPMSATVVVLGNPGSGKSSVIEDICFWNKHRTDKNKHNHYEQRKLTQKPLSPLELPESNQHSRTSIREDRRQKNLSPGRICGRQL